MQEADWLEAVWPLPGRQIKQNHGAALTDGHICCQGCKLPIARADFIEQHGVCRACNWHHRLSAKARLRQLCADAVVNEIGAEIKIRDPLGFEDSKHYSQRLLEAQAKTGSSEALLAVTTKIKDIAVSIAIFDFNFIGGSMGAVVGERFVLAVEHAIKHQQPLILVTASGGARMQEGAVALMQMAKTSMAVAKLHQAGIPFISILTDPTTGGVAASIAMQADIILAEPNALIGFTGKRVLAQTTKQDLPAGFQRAEFLYAQGAIDRIVHRHHLREEIDKIISLLAKRGAATEQSTRQVKSRKKSGEVELCGGG